MKYKIIIEYDGTNYLGWQKQVDRPLKAIEDILQNAIFKLTTEKVKINCCGRTDSGVHALGQVADFDLKKQFQPFRILMGLNYFLSEEQISILSCHFENSSFHSRYSAKQRHYQYLILNRRAPPAINKNRVFHMPTKLNIAKMQEGANYLIGQHDFSSFRDAKCQAGHAVRSLSKINLSQDNEMIKVDISAKSFLHHMVRNIIGTLVLVGQEKITPQNIDKILKAKNRVCSGPNAPACGLYFLGADY